VPEPRVSAALRAMPHRHVPNVLLANLLLTTDLFATAVQQTHIHLPEATQKRNVNAILDMYEEAMVKIFVMDVSVENTMMTQLAYPVMQASILPA
tara:strand:+ start:628 stop:912 length:285 start_codon:yes stop_codon:yes gene_type:complete